MAENDNDEACDRCYVREVFEDRLIDYLKVLLTDEQKMELIDWLKYSKNPFAEHEGDSN